MTHTHAFHWNISQLNLLYRPGLYSICSARLMTVTIHCTAAVTSSMSQAAINIYMQLEKSSSANNLGQKVK